MHPKWRMLPGQFFSFFGGRLVQKRLPLTERGQRLISEGSLTLIIEWAHRFNGRYYDSLRRRGLAVTSLIIVDTPTSAPGWVMSPLQGNSCRHLLPTTVARCRANFGRETNNLKEGEAHLGNHVSCSECSICDVWNWKQWVENYQKIVNKWSIGGIWWEVHRLTYLASSLLLG